MKRAGIRVAGIVQGVGFRPFVYRLAQQYKLNGFVLNDEKGVWIEVEGEEAVITNFIIALDAEKPAMSMIADLQTVALSVQGEDSFVIKPSPAAKQRFAFISPDIATCPDCRRELQSVADRRFGYAFTNCTNCGPRYSIIKDVPYDRPQTTMQPFVMCKDCQAEYDDPMDRRFHAQPNACETCGPSYRLLDSKGQVIPSDNPLKSARDLIKNGAILAVKGIGGYHLICDARNETAVATLRSRKIREDKPFALMGGSLSQVEQLCFVSPKEKDLLTGSVGPIVLLKKKNTTALAQSVAPSNPYLGVMLPYAPIHYLLLEAEDVFVMTSGNTSDEPIAYKDEDTLRRLAGIADYFLVHNREIYCRVDDSVVRLFKKEPYLLRRSRGLAPAPIHLAKAGPMVLACGGEAKNTFCLTKSDAAFLSAHIGDLENRETMDSYAEAIAHYGRLFDIKPELIAYDLHPEYLSTKYAKQLELPQIGVQHHHAHIASVLAEHNIHEPVIGVAFDGTGYGEDGKLWGGEFLLADCQAYKRLAHCAYLPLPGGEKAVREPWRQAMWVMQNLYGDRFLDKQTAFTKALPNGWELLLQATAKGLNAPLTSSAGRLFDTAAALIGLRQYNHYEGQAAVELELAAADTIGRALPYEITAGNTIDFRPTFAAMIENINRVSRAELAAGFHTTMAIAIHEMVQRLSSLTGVRKVALSGGVFQNMTLLRQVYNLLEKDFIVLLNRKVPPNDGGLALGQAVIARERGR